MIQIPEKNRISHIRLHSACIEPIHILACMFNNFFKMSSKCFNSGETDLQEAMEIEDQTHIFIYIDRCLYSSMCVHIYSYSVSF